MRHGAGAGFSLIEAVIALMIATMALSFIGTAGYSLRFAAERESTSIDGPDDRLALRRILQNLLRETVAVSGDAQTLILGPETEARRFLRIRKGGEKGWQLVLERSSANPYPLPSLLLESGQPLRFQYRTNGPEGVVMSQTASSGTDTVALLESPNKVVARASINRGISPDCLLRTGPRGAEQCLP